MRKFNFKKIFLVTAFALCSTSVTAPAMSSGIQSELNDLFGSMSNVTQPGVYESTRRGVIAGGGATIRSRRMNIQLMSFEPPNIKAGCGGIDVFLGSFSYINLDQFISFLRAIAANAAGYAFQMALKVSCSMCSNIMETMQKIAQIMNNMNMSSCQLAMGLVEDTYDALNGKRDFNRTIDNVKKGLSIDTNEDKSGATQGQEKNYNADPQGYTEKHLGNIVWKAMKKKNVNAWFGLGPNETALMETLMSISGTVVLEKPKQGVTPLVFPVNTYEGGKVTLRDFVEGSKRTEGNVTGVDSKMYSCESDKTDCMAPKLNKDVNIRGLAQVIEEELNKDDGIIAKYARDRGDGQSTFTPQQQALISNMPQVVGKAIHDLAMGSEEQARTMSPRIARVVSLTMTYSLMTELFNAVKAATHGLDDVQKKEIQVVLDKSEKRINDEYMQLMNEYGTEKDLTNEFASIVQFMQYESPLHGHNPRVQTYAYGSID